MTSVLVMPSDADADGEVLRSVPMRGVLASDAVIC